MADVKKGKKILLTGGGSAGHVTPNLALLPFLKEQGYDVEYMGSFGGIERELVNISYHPISTGKLRRYLSWQNFTDIFRIFKGLVQAYFCIRRIKPRLVFSKGGFVSVPVAIAAWARGVPVIIHEADITPGLANRLTAPFAVHICVSFPETLQLFPAGKASLTGLPVRQELLSGNRQRGLELCGFSTERPMLLIMGGSLGSTIINKAVRQCLSSILEVFQVAHICGKGKTDKDLNNQPGYRQFEYISSQLPDILAAADMVISRAGANALFELMALGKISLLIPLSMRASRGDQIKNAESFSKRGLCSVLQEEDLNPQNLTRLLAIAYKKREYTQAKIKREASIDSIQAILSLIRQYVGS